LISMKCWKASGGGPAWSMTIVAVSRSSTGNFELRLRTWRLGSSKIIFDSVLIIPIKKWQVKLVMAVKNNPVRNQGYFHVHLFFPNLFLDVSMSLFICQLITPRQSGWNPSNDTLHFTNTHSYTYSLTLSLSISLSLSTRYPQTCCTWPLQLFVALPQDWWR
jgi:hypothetical protein